MEFQVLTSAMFQSDFSIVEKSNLKCPVLIINQCNEEGVSVFNGAKMISTTERGLSRSRNMALSNAEGEICLISDDDEFFIDDLQSQILNAYKEIPEADVIIFGTEYKSHICNKPTKLKRLQLLKVSSVQISFKLNSIKNKFNFDNKLGAGTGNGAGEETKFLWDCYSKGLKIYYYPVKILSLREKQSTWFTGYDEAYFYNRGKVTRYIMGRVYATLYAYYYVLSHRNLYKKNLSAFKALKNILKGIKEDKLNENT